MSEGIIDLEEILQSELSDNYPAFELSSGDNVSYERAILAMKEACRQALELAAENARTYLETFDSSNYHDWTTVVNRESITNTINQIK